MPLNNVIFTIVKAYRRESKVRRASWSLSGIIYSVPCDLTISLMALSGLWNKDGKLAQTAARPGGMNGLSSHSLFHDALKSIGCSRSQPSGADRCQSILCPINRWGTSAFQCVCETFDTVLFCNTVLLCWCLIPDDILLYADIKDTQTVKLIGFSDFLNVR